MKRFKVQKDGFSLRSMFAPSASQVQPRETEQPTPKRKRPAPLSLRLTAEERTRLEHDAAGMSVSGYIRERLFGENAKTRKTRGKFPVKDHQALARVLRALGDSNLSRTTKALAVRMDRDAECLSSDNQAAIAQACADIAAIRRDLITALGLKSEPTK